MRRLLGPLAAALACGALLPSTLAAAPSSTLSPAGLSGPDLSPYDGRSGDDVWQDLVRLDKVPAGYDGSGVTVALIDTGVTPSPDLGDRVLARVDMSPERDGIDRFGHGTHMAGLIAGDGSSSHGVWQGAAPGAGLVSVKVAGWNGAADVTSVIAALRWVVTNRDRFGIRVVNLSYGTDGTQGYLADPLDRAVERATEAGILVVVAAGNDGPAAGSVDKPGDDPAALTVGAFDDQNTTQPGVQHVAEFSARGPTQDGLDKPDIVAPGVSLVSLRAPGSVADTFRPEARVGSAYFKGSGTSQSAAIVSGVAARVFQADPSLTPAQVKALLLDTADDNLQGQPGAGAGAVNARDAVQDALRHATIRRRRYAPGTGAGTIEGSRGAEHVFADLDGDGAAEPVQGEVDVLGLPWDPATVAEPWTPATWALSPWAPLAVETPGLLPTPEGPAAWLGAGPDAGAWAARNWTDAGWDARNWSARNWTARNWS